MKETPKEAAKEIHWYLVITATILSLTALITIPIGFDAINNIKQGMVATPFLERILNCIVIFGVIATISALIISTRVSVYQIHFINYKERKSTEKK